MTRRPYNTIYALWGMARPTIMLSVIAVYFAGMLMARAEGSPADTITVGWGLAALLLVSLSIHYTNEYADYETDALTDPTPFSGGSGVLASGIVPRALAMQAAWVTLIAGLLLALVGIALGLLAWPALGLLIVGGFFGWMYSLPPLKLAWKGWGELDNALLGGLALPLYGYSVQTGTVTPAAALAWLPFTLFVFVNLLATTWADRRADAQVGKRTLATRWPVPVLRGLYVLVVATALVCLPLHLPPEVGLLSVLALPVIVVGAWAYTRWHSPAPTVYAMMVLLFAQMAGWLAVGL